MKKLLLSFALVLAASLSALAQDIIILKSSEKIEAKIVEISSSEIAYKKVNYLDGPTFRILIRRAERGLSVLQSVMSVSRLTTMG